MNNDLLSELGNLVNLRGDELKTLFERFEEITGYPVDADLIDVSDIAILRKLANESDNLR